MTHLSLFGVTVQKTAAVIKIMYKSDICDLTLDYAQYVCTVSKPKHNFKCMPEGRHETEEMLVLINLWWWMLLLLKASSFCWLQ
jgi:hypothetical protein